MECGVLPPPLQSKHWRDQDSRGKPGPEKAEQALALHTNLAALFFLAVSAFMSELQPRPHKKRWFFAACEDRHTNTTAKGRRDSPA